MRFIHTADLHLGASPDASLPWGQERREALWNSLHTIIRAARDRHADLLLIAGDLFHRQPLLKECREVNSLFSQIPSTRVVMIAGNHDCIRPSSPFVSYPWAPNVSVLSSESMDSVWLPELNTRVHGFSYHRPEIREPLYDGLSVPEDGAFHILLAHGGDDSHIPIRLNDLAAAGFDYVALGHIHQPKLYKKSAIAWCGSPEPLDRTDMGRRGYILGDIDESGCRFSWVPCASAEYRPISITVNPGSTSHQILEVLQEQLDPDPRYLYRVILTGSREPDLTFDPAVISRAGRIVDVTDRTEPAYDLARLTEEHSHDLVSHLIRELSAGGPDEPDSLSGLRRKALYYGLQALLDPEE